MLCVHVWWVFPSRMSGSPEAAPAGTQPASGELPGGLQLSQDALEWSWMLSPELRGNFSALKVLPGPALPSVRCKGCSPKGGCSGRMQNGAGELGKAVRNKTQLVKSVGKPRWELRRGAGSGWCNLGDGDKEPKRRERRAGAGTGRELGRDGGSPFPKLDRGSGMEPVEGLEGHKAVLRRSRARDGEQEGEAGETAGERSEVGGKRERRGEEAVVQEQEERSDRSREEHG